MFSQYTYYRIAAWNAVFRVNRGPNFVHVDYELSKVYHHTDGGYWRRFRLWELCNGMVPGAELIMEEEYQEIFDAVQQLQEARTKGR